MSSLKMASSIKSRPVTVLGAGVLGRRIATVWAAAGYPVNIYDTNEASKNAAVHYVDTNVSSFAKKLTGKTDQAPGKVSGFSDLEEAVKDSWTVIEAVPEELSLKTDIFKQLAELTKDDCLLATNSSSYKSSEMITEVKDESVKKRVLNTHYMMPPDQRVVELMTCGVTSTEVLEFYEERLREAGMSPLTAVKESTGFVLDRIWAAVKRETLAVINEGITTPEKLDRAYVETWAGNKNGPCSMMDAVGLDTVQSIEQHYVKERGLSTKQTVDFLEKDYISEGKLGAKSGKGGLYPAGYTSKTTKEESSTHDNIHAPMLYFLDLGMNHQVEDALHSGTIQAMSSAGGELRTIVGKQTLPDGLDISFKTNRIYWTNMGIPPVNDGLVQSCNLDGSDVQALTKPGSVHTPKQCIIDHENSKLYFCDREGLRVMRINLDGSDHEILVQRGDFNIPEETQDQTRWCVGIGLDSKNNQFYWTQKGFSKSGKGRIFRANMTMPKGETPSTRSDIELLFTGLPEPIDLEFDHEGQKLYWTDRGDPPFGNTINRADMGALKHIETKEDNPKYEIIARNMHEAIGIKLDLKNRHIYATDLGGAIYRFGMDAGGKKEKVFESEDGCHSGITLAHT